MRYRAKHIVAYAIYSKFQFLGKWSRRFVSAWPSADDAEEELHRMYHKTIPDWMGERTYPDYRKLFMIEEMSATMKSWTPPSIA